MKLSEGVEWALHCTWTLAANPSVEPLYTCRLAEFYDLPATHLAKVLTSLVRAGVPIARTGPVWRISPGATGGQDHCSRSARSGRGTRPDILLHRDSPAWASTLSVERPAGLPAESQGSWTSQPWGYGGERARSDHHRRSRRIAGSRRTRADVEFGLNIMNKARQSDGTKGDRPVARGD